MQLDQGQMGNITAEMELKISVPFFFLLRHSGYDSSHHMSITNFHNGVRLAQLFAWLAFLDCYEDKAVSFWGIHRGLELYYMFI